MVLEMVRGSPHQSKLTHAEAYEEARSQTPKAAPCKREQRGGSQNATRKPPRCSYWKWMESGKREEGMSWDVDGKFENRENVFGIGRGAERDCRVCGWKWMGSGERGDNVNGH